MDVIVLRQACLPVHSSGNIWTWFILFSKIRWGKQWRQGLKTWIHVASSFWKIEQAQLTGSRWQESVDVPRSGCSARSKRPWRLVCFPEKIFRNFPSNKKLFRTLCFSSMAYRLWWCEISLETDEETCLLAATQDSRTDGRSLKGRSSVPVWGNGWRMWFQ